MVQAFLDPRGTRCCFGKLEGLNLPDLLKHISCLAYAWCSKRGTGFKRTQTCLPYIPILQVLVRYMNKLSNVLGIPSFIHSFLSLLSLSLFSLSYNTCPVLQTVLNIL
jgi:hypothetical protein